MRVLPLDITMTATVLASARTSVNKGGFSGGVEARVKIAAALVFATPVALLYHTLGTVVKALILNKDCAKHLENVYKLAIGTLLLAIGVLTPKIGLELYEALNINHSKTPVILVNTSEKNGDDLVKVVTSTVTTSFSPIKTEMHADATPVPMAPPMSPPNAPPLSSPTETPPPPPPPVSGFAPIIAKKKDLFAELSNFKLKAKEAATKDAQAPVSDHDSALKKALAEKQKGTLKPKKEFKTKTPEELAAFAKKAEEKMALDAAKRAAVAKAELAAKMAF